MSFQPAVKIYTVLFLAVPEIERHAVRVIIITQNGKSASVLLSVEDFERLRETVELIDDVRAAEAEIERGETFSTPEVEAYLKKEGLL